MRIDCCGNLYTGLLLCNIANLRYVQTKIEGIIKEKPMAEKKKVLYIVEVNSTPFVRQYDILFNKWGVLLCQKEYQTNDIRRNSREWL